MEPQPSSTNSDSTFDSKASSSGSKSTYHSKKPVMDEIAMMAIECDDRWQVYFRLQDLNIPCQCKSHQPLLVNIQSAQALVQVCGVVKRFSTPRSDLCDWLNHCFSLPSFRLDF